MNQNSTASERRIDDVFQTAESVGANHEALSAAARAAATPDAPPADTAVTDAVMVELAETSTGRPSRQAVEAALSRLAQDPRDAHAWAVLGRFCDDFARNFCWGRLKQAREDFAQDLKLHLFRLTLEGKLEGTAKWLTTIAFNLGRDKGRQAMAAAKLFRGNSAAVENTQAAEPGPLERAADEEQLEALTQALATLPAAQRAAVVGVITEGRTRRDLAAQAGIRHQSVNCCLARALKALRASLTAD